jgi:mycothiol synthase
MIGQGFTVRPPVPADAQAVATIIRACEEAYWGKGEVTADDVRDDWAHSPNFRLDTDAWLVLKDGQPVGCADLSSRQPIRLGGFCRVHPTFRGQGIEEHLLRLVEARARELAPAAPDGLRVVLDSETAAQDHEGRAIYEAHGFQAIRHFWRMVRDLSEEPAPPTWPEGITVRPIVVGQDDFLVYSTNRDAFQDHWGHYPAPFETWRDARMSGMYFDPSLWFLAMDGEEAAGVLLCVQTPEVCWVANLGVRRPWRRRGLGEALIRHAFGEFYRRGRKEVVLGVDAASPTGAVALYERAGMTVSQEHVVYEKELRPGEEFVSGS